MWILCNQATNKTTIHHLIKVGLSNSLNGNPHLVSGYKPLITIIKHGIANLCPSVCIASCWFILMRHRRYLKITVIKGNSPFKKIAFFLSNKDWIGKHEVQQVLIEYIKNTVYWTGVRLATVQYQKPLPLFPFR